MSNQYYYGHGKLLLTGEYFVLDGAKSLALPTKMGQKMNVSYKRSDSPKLIWKSIDLNGKVWFESSYELWHFDILSNESEDAKVLQKILRQARKQNIHFLREELDIIVETTLEFPLEWGLGSSSTLLYNIAQWAYISPFELQDKTFGGSGYDIACAQSLGPIVYSNTMNCPEWKSVLFSPLFKNDLYFVYLNKKVNSRKAIHHYNNINIENKKAIITRIDHLTDAFLHCLDLKEFNELVFEHENLLAHSLDMVRAKDIFFKDFWGEIKSLGAWGGDFVLATSDRGLQETKLYFKNKGFENVLTYEQMINESIDMNHININNINKSKEMSLDV